MIDLDNANETDVREEIVTPFLSSLGYKRGTQNSISREHSLNYPHIFLGRKKPTDPKIRGRADYILSVLGSGRWVLEVKAPSEDLDLDSIEQCLTYARHPEISASYAALTNGRRFVIYSVNQTASEEPIFACAIETPEDLAFFVTGLLSPEAILRKCTPPIVDMGKPLAVGFGSSLKVVGGEISYNLADFEIGEGLPDQMHIPLKLELEKRMVFLRNYTPTIVGGKVYRDSNSRIIANTLWAMPTDELKAFANNSGLMDADYICLEDSVSNDQNNPSTFDITGGFDIDQGEPVYNILEWRSEKAEAPTNLTYQGTVTGYLKDGKFQGVFKTTFYILVDLGIIKVPYSIMTSGQFSVQVAD